MNVMQTAAYPNVSVAWVYREAHRVGLVPYRFSAGPNAKLQFKVSEVQSWVRQPRLSGQ